MLNASFAGLFTLAASLADVVSGADVSGADIAAVSNAVSNADAGKYAELFTDRGTLITVVTLTGILVVFFALFLLILIFGIFGLSDKAKKKAAAAAKQQTVAPKAPAQAAAPNAVKFTPAAPAVSDGIPGEVIAAIAAAVAYMEDGKSYTVRSVRRAPQTQGRPAWSTAAILENTRPF